MKPGVDIVSLQASLQSVDWYSISQAVLSEDNRSTHFYVRIEGISVRKLASVDNLATANASVASPSVHPQS